MWTFYRRRWMCRLLSTTAHIQRGHTQYGTKSWRQVWAQHHVCCQLSRCVGPTFHAALTLLNGWCLTQMFFRGRCVGSVCLNQGSRQIKTVIALVLTVVVQPSHGICSPAQGSICRKPEWICWVAEGRASGIKSAVDDRGIDDVIDLAHIWVVTVKQNLKHSRIPTVVRGPVIILGLGFAAQHRTPSCVAASLLLALGWGLSTALLRSICNMSLPPISGAHLSGFS